MANGRDRQLSVEELRSQVERLHAELSQRDSEVAGLKMEVARASSELEDVRKLLEDCLARLSQELEQAEMKGELKMLRALDGLRAEHQRMLEREVERTDQWIPEIKDSYAAEKTRLLQRIAELERDEVCGRDAWVVTM